MAWELTLELEVGGGIASLVGAALVCGATLEEQSATRLTGMLGEESVFISAQTATEPSPLLTEGLDASLTWLVGLRMVFRSTYDQYEVGRIEMKRFLEALSAQTQARFVLSFQYEETFAIRDDKGLRYFSSFLES